MREGRFVAASALAVVADLLSPLDALEFIFVVCDPLERDVDDFVASIGVGCIGVGVCGDWNAAEPLFW